MSANQPAMQKILADKKTTTEEGLALYDSLEPVSPEFMYGRWSGFEIETGHPMDGLLVPSGWYGKIFFGDDEVHPLVFFGSDKKELYAVNPFYIPTNLQLPKNEFLGTLIGMSRVMLETSSSKARLRNTEYRGKVTATMIYDEKPIHDMFVKLDDNRVLGAMDLKGQPLPYFFVLERDDSSEYEVNIFEEAPEKFRALFEMEVQNRAFALTASEERAEGASNEGDALFYGAWADFERFLRGKYAPFAEKYGLTQEAKTMAKLQAGLGGLAADILPNSMVYKRMLEETIAYAEKLRELRDVSPEGERDFFSFVVVQEELQIEALRLRIDEKNQEAADLLRRFIAEHSSA
ncbi:MAG: DUF4334 domain-containing protein [Planctomycetota bacterium]